MNKKVLKVAFVAAIALMCGVNVFNVQKSESLSDIALANVEALAGDESVENIKCNQIIDATCILFNNQPVKGERY